MGREIKVKKQKIVKNNQFIVAEIDAKLGAFGIIPQELEGAIVSSHYFLFELDKSQINPKFFDYMIRYGQYEKSIQRFVRGTTNYASIRSSDVLQLTMPLPDLNIQELIVDRIEKQESIIHYTNKTIQSLREGLVDKSDFEGNWLSEDLESVCKEIRNGGTPTRNVSSYFGGKISWVKSGELEDNEITKTEESLTQAGVKNSNAKPLPKGTVLIALYGATIGKTAILRIEAATNQAVSGLVPDENKILSEYLRYYLITLRSYYLQMARGIAQKNINADIMKSIKIPLPSKEIQQEIVDKINARKNTLTQLENTEKRSTTIITNIIKSIGQM
ncbi:MAG: restriction endonuclease subunit S [Thaumarchaeota archaeon]|nr:restriction endonuclease subunit S [Nitrososphaerota archaeon]